MAEISYNWSKLMIIERSKSMYWYWNYFFKLNHLFSSIWFWQYYKTTSLPFNNSNSVSNNLFVLIIENRFHVRTILRSLLSTGTVEPIELWNGKGLSDSSDDFKQQLVQCTQKQFTLDVIFKLLVKLFALNINYTYKIAGRLPIPQFYGSHCTFQNYNNL